VSTFPPADGPASCFVTVGVTDDGLPSLSTAETIIITVNNVAPTVTAPGDAELPEGDALTGSGSFTDPGADTWMATVDYGDGFGPQPLALNPDKSFDLDHAYADNGTYTVTVVVTDKDGDSGTASFTLTVTN